MAAWEYRTYPILWWQWLLMLLGVGAFGIFLFLYM